MVEQLGMSEAIGPRTIT